MIEPNVILPTASAFERMDKEAIAWDGGDDSAEVSEEDDDVLKLVVVVPEVDKEPKKHTINPALISSYNKILNFLGLSNQTGVVDERPYKLKDTGNPDEETLTATYQGKLTRELIGMIVKDVMKRREIPVRTASEATNISTSTIMAIRQGNASIDKGLALLEALGCQLEAQFDLKAFELDPPEVP